MAEQKSITAYKQQLRERIVTTAMAAFAAQGIRAVKMDDLAQQLSISKRTMYELYENKENLLYECIKRHRSRQQAEAMAYMRQGPNVIEVLLHEYRKSVGQFRQTVPQFYADLERYPRVMAQLEQDQKENRSRLLAFMMRGVDEGYFRSDIDYDMVLFMLDSIGIQIMSQKLYWQYSFEQIFHHLVFTYLRGLCTQQGIGLLDRLLAEEK